MKASCPTRRVDRIVAPGPHRTDAISPLLAGAVCLSSLGDLLPIVLAPLAGRLADCIESVRLLALSSALQAVVALGLAFTTSLAACPRTDTGGSSPSTTRRATPLDG